LTAVQALREAWLPALLGFPVHPQVFARSVRDEGLGFVRLWPSVRATVPGWTGIKEGRSLYALAHHGPAEGAIVELGSAWGRSTICLARGSKAAGREPVHTIDLHLMAPAPDPWPRAGVQKGLPRSDAGETTLPWLVYNLRRFGVDDWVVPIVASSDSATTLGIDKVRLLFVDGAHTYERVSADIDAWLPRVVAGGVLVFDDYFGSKPTWGVRAAVDELLASGNVRSALGRVGTHVWTVKL
jgi:predicted O-methyltransferase YrrM